MHADWKARSKAIIKKIKWQKKKMGKNMRSHFTEGDIEMQTST